MRQLISEVERKAFEIFEQRGGSIGGALDDWLRAERETLAPPPAELSESDSGYTLKAVVPGYSGTELQVTATPHEILVQGERANSEDGAGEQVRWSELPVNGRFCRHVPLPAAIDVDKVSATLEAGMLVIRAAKTTTAIKRKKVAAGK